MVMKLHILHANDKTLLRIKTSLGFAVGVTQVKVTVSKNGFRSIT